MHSLGRYMVARRLCILRYWYNCWVGLVQSQFHQTFPFTGADDPTAIRSSASRRLEQLLAYSRL